MYNEIPVSYNELLKLPRTGNVDRLASNFRDKLIRNKIESVDVVRGCVLSLVANNLYGDRLPADYSIKENYFWDMIANDLLARNEKELLEVAEINIKLFFQIKDMNSCNAKMFRLSLVEEVVYHG
jgi:hypothetical protein